MSGVVNVRAMDAIRSIPAPGMREPLRWRVAGTLGAAGVAALLASIPGSFRRGDLRDGAALVALALVPALVFVTLSVLVKRGAHAFDLRSLTLRSGVSALILFNIAAILAGFLRRTTHHHTLAGATFALALTVSLLLCLPIAGKIALSLGNGATVRSTPSVVLLVVLTLMASRSAGALLRSPSGTITFDLLALILAAVFASPLRKHRAVVVAFPLALLIAIAGCFRVFSHPPYASSEIQPVTSALSKERVGRALTFPNGDLT